LAEFAASIGTQLHVVRQVANESLWIDHQDADGVREHVEVDSLTNGAQIQQVSLEGNELPRFIELSFELGDGEAATLSLVESRRWLLVTDDRKAIKVSRDLDPQPDVIGTPAILRAWSRGRPATEISNCLLLIEARAHYRPASGYPDGDWWRAHAAPDRGSDDGRLTADEPEAGLS